MTTHDSGAGPLGFFFWVQALLVLLYIGVPVLLVGAAVWWATRRARLDMPAGLVRRARSARLAGLASGLILGVLAIQLGQELLAPASVAIGYLFGLLTAELLWVPAPTGVAVPGPVGGRPYLISRILVWCGISLPIAAVLVWCVMGWWKRLVVEPPAAAPAGPAAG